MIRMVLVFLSLVLFVGCGEPSNEGKELSAEELHEFLDSVVENDVEVGNTNDSALEGKSFVEVLKYWNNSDEFKDCKRDRLQTLSEITVIAATTTKKLDAEFADSSGNWDIEKILNFASNPQEDLKAYDQDKITMYLLKRAAVDGDAIAMNEIGASLLFCYQHVKQDLASAEMWLSRAVEAGDNYAALNLARMHLAGMTNSEDPENTAFRLLRTCSWTDQPECKNLFEELRAKIRSRKKD